MPQLTMLEAIRETLASEMANDDRTLLLGLDVGQLGGVFRATEGLADQFGHHRVVDTPIAEGAMIGAAIGLSVAGVVPLVEIQFTGFLQQAFHQIAGQLSRFRSRSNGRFSCPVTIRAPFGSGLRTPELHSDSPESILAHIPGLKVVMPSDAYEAKGLLTAAIRDPDPVLFLEPIRLYRSQKVEVPEDTYELPLGKLEVVRDGSDITIVAWGPMVDRSLAAAHDLSSRGVSAMVVSLRSIAPLDVEQLVEVVSQTGRAVVVHEATKTCGFGAEIAATIQEDAYFSLEAPVMRVTSPDVPPPLGDLEDLYFPGEAAITDAVLRTMAL